MDSKPAHRRSMTSQSTDDTKPSVTKRYRVAIFAPASLNSYQLKRCGILPGYRLIYKSNMKCKPDLKQLGGMPDGPYRAPSAIDNTSLPARADNRWKIVCDLSSNVDSPLRADLKHRSCKVVLLERDAGSLRQFLGRLKDKVKTQFKAMAEQCKTCGQGRRASGESECDLCIVKELDQQDDDDEDNDDDRRLYRETKERAREMFEEYRQPWLPPREE